MSDRPDFAGIEAHVRRSVIVKTIEATGRAWRMAREHSATAARLEHMCARFRSLPSPSRVRVVAVGVASAAGGYLLLLNFVPAQVAPELPRGAWLLVFAWAVLIAVGSERFTASWRSSSLRRLWSAVGGANR
jgi:hypothetical protein